MTTIEKEKMLSMLKDAPENSDYIITEKFKMVPYTIQGFYIEIQADDIPESEKPGIIDEILEYEHQKYINAYKARYKKRQGVKIVSLDALQDAYNEKTA